MFSTPTKVKGPKEVRLLFPLAAVALFVSTAFLSSLMTTPISDERVSSHSSVRQLAGPGNVSTTTTNYIEPQASLQQPQPSWPNPGRLCHQNPYTAAGSGLLDDASLDQIAQRADVWLRNISNHYLSGPANNKPDMTLHNHDRFAPFEVMASCTASKACVGGPCGADTSKIMCGLEQLKKKENDECIIYSIGGNNHWEFELDLLEKTPCQVHTFDCTGSTDRFVKPEHDRLHFHHVCLGTRHEDAVPVEQCKGLNKCGETWTLLEMQQRLKHKRIDLFKMDIEGYEWPLLESWPELADPGADELVLPMQILTEVHYRTQFGDLYQIRGTNARTDFRYHRDMVNLQAHLLRMGYVVAERDDNRFCGHCTELTLIRSRCPGTGAYAAEGVAAVATN